MKNYGHKNQVAEKKYQKTLKALEELGVDISKIIKGESKVGITRKSHEETKKHKKMAAKSVKINRKQNKVNRVRR